VGVLSSKYEVLKMATNEGAKKPPGGDGEAKWAVLLDDRVVPMPRRMLNAKDILHQAGAKSGSQLVRDFNDPNDIAFEGGAMVDLAEGNVFRTATGCKCSQHVTADAPPKLAFIVDDRWEVTIQPHQTGETLRGLLNIPQSSELLRDNESPNDDPIDDGDAVEFKDGPVFTTSRKGLTIIVEATPHQWFESRISYVQVVTLFDPSYPQHPDITYSVTYKRGPAARPEGILTPSASVKVKDCMVFNVSQTGQS
jgi:hypothetical protein